MHFSQFKLICGAFGLVLVCVVTLIRQRRFDYPDIARGIGACFVAVSLPTAFEICWNAVLPEPALAVEPEGARLAALVGGMALALVSGLGFWKLLIDAYRHAPESKQDRK